MVKKKKEPIKESTPQQSNKPIDLSGMSDLALDAKLGQFYEELNRMQQVANQFQNGINTIRAEKQKRQEVKNTAKNWGKEGQAKIAGSRKNN